MSTLSLEQAQAIVAGALKHARDLRLKPLLVLVLDARAAPKACAAEDGTSRNRWNVAFGKANGALAMGIGSRTLARRGRDTPAFMGSVAAVIDGGMVLGPGGVLIRDQEGAIVGAVGISGDTGDNDEAAAIAGIQAADFKADPGADNSD